MSNKWRMNKVKLVNSCIKEMQDRNVKAKRSSNTGSEGATATGKKAAAKASVLKGEPDPSLEAKGESKAKATVLKPEDQLSLQESELREDITKTLSTINPQTPKNLVEYSYRKCEFVPKPQASATIVLLSLEGCAIPKDSPEAQAQLASSDYGGDQRKKTSKQISDADDEEGDADKEEEGEEKEEGGNAEEENGKGEEKPEEEEQEVEAPASAPAPKTQKKLTNAFNFCERAALASSNTTREVSTQTVPPPRSVFSGLVTQWIIYDAYAEDYEKQMKEKEKEKKPPPIPSMRKEDSKKKSDSAASDVFHNRANEAANIVDRMICQNIFDEIAQDYKYYEDPSDEYRSEEGTLLPLWKFTYEKTKKSSVTDISWNPQYYDLFAVTFGTFDFSKEPEQDGAVCLFTLKNPSYPEYITHTECGAMSVATHPTQSYLIVIGLHDGNVAVYNTTLPEKTPQFQSNSVKNKHWGIVWQVKWGVDLPDGEINFYSVSADGKVYNWILMQNELAVTLVISLRLPLDPIIGPDGSVVNVNDCGCTINFHPQKPLIFLVGTEQGSIYKCSTEYSSMFLFKYDAHHMPVHKISYNLFYPDIFLSCSADWSVKIWEDMKGEPLFVFDLGCSVGDVQWAPYSSTVFAAATVDGKCHVFDINVNKYKSICDQNVVSGKKNRLTRLRFNYKMPIIVVGDDKGCLTTLKLSPNLRIKTKPPKKQQFIEPQQLEVMKLEKLLALVREPTSVAIDGDKESAKSD